MSLTFDKNVIHFDTGCIYITFDIRWLLNLENKLNA